MYLFHGSRIVYEECPLGQKSFTDMLYEMGIFPSQGSPCIAV